MKYPPQNINLFIFLYYNNKQTNVQKSANDREEFAASTGELKFSSIKK